MHADVRGPIRSSARWFIWLALVAACSPGPSPSPLPEVPPPPEGWVSVGAIQGETSPGWAVSRFTFAGRAAAVNASCRGAGTVFVIVDWPDLTQRSGPAELQTVAVPCASPIEATGVSRIELSTAPTGDVDVNVFIVEGAGAIGRTSFAVSIEELAPEP